MDSDIEALYQIAQKYSKFWVVTVVHTQGSSPRKEGAKMIVGSHGELLWGSIGGGVIERLACATTKKLTGPKLISYNVGEQNDSIEEIEKTGMICGGTMSLYYEPHGLIARPRVWIFGAGHCGKAVYDILATQDWTIIMLDNRPEVLTEEAFPLAERRVGHYLDLIKTAVNEFTPEDYVLIITSGHRFDYQILDYCIPKKLKYLGMMGSQRKINLKFEQLRKEGIPEERLKQINAPIGLNLGGQSPQEIAVDIVAKLIQVRYQKTIKRDE